jgi:hypothetical protein
VHDSPWLFNDFIDHNLLGEGLLYWSHLDLLFHFSVLDFVDHGLELWLLLVGVLVLDGLWLIRYCFNLGGASAVGLALASTGSRGDGRSSTGSLREGLVTVASSAEEW